MWRQVQRLVQWRVRRPLCRQIWRQVGEGCGDGHAPPLCPSPSHEISTLVVRSSFASAQSSPAHVPIHMSIYVPMHLCIHMSTHMFRRRRAALHACVHADCDYHAGAHMSARSAERRGAACAIPAYLVRANMRPCSQAGETVRGQRDRAWERACLWAAGVCAWLRTNGRAGQVGERARERTHGWQALAGVMADTARKRRCHIHSCCAGHRRPRRSRC